MNCFVFTVLLLLSLSDPQRTLAQLFTVQYGTFNKSFYSFNAIAATATLNVTIEIDQLYMGINSDSGFIGIGSGDELMIKVYAPTLSIDVVPLFGATGTTGSVPIGGAPQVCSYSEWSSSKVKGTLTKAIKLLDRRILTLDASLPFFDRINFRNFPRPKIGFSVIGFEDDSGYLDCTYRSVDDDNYASQSFADLQLCYTEGSVCNVYIGTSNEIGWLYFGGTSASPYYGIHVNPTWSLSGTRRSLDVLNGRYFDVPAIASTSDIYSTQVINETFCPVFEMDVVTLRNGSALVMHLNRRGELVRYLNVYSLTVESNVAIVLDLSEIVISDKVSSMQFNLPRIIEVYFGSVSTSSFVLSVYNAPTNWTVLSKQFSYAPISGYLAVNATVGLPSAAITTTTTAATTPAPTIVVYRCERNCAGHGLCVADGMCQCQAGWANDPNNGCVDENELRTEATDATNVVISNVVNPSMVANATAETGGDNSNTADNASSSGGSSVDGTQAPAQRMQPGSPDADNTVAIAAGAGAGGLVCLLLICGLIICLVNRRRRNAEKETEETPSVIPLTEKKGVSSSGVYASSSGAMGNYVGASNVAGTNDSVYKSPSSVDPSGSADYAFMPTTELPTTMESSGGDMYTVPDIKAKMAAESSGGDVYTVPALPEQSVNSDYAQIDVRASKKGGFKPEGVEIEYDQFDPNSARFEKYKD